MPGDVYGFCWQPLLVQGREAVGFVLDNVGWQPPAAVDVQAEKPDLWCRGLYQHLGYLLQT